MNRSFLRTLSLMLPQSLVVGALVVGGSPCRIASAQEFQEGISGTVDSKRRAPVIGVSTERTTSSTKILVDAYIPNGEFQEYPIRFDIYVNRHLFVSQMRSKELPGAVGADVPDSVATPPFNYQIVATVLHPNRQFTSVAQGAVYATNLAGTFSCRVETTGDSGTVTYQSTEAAAKQQGPASISLEFEAAREDGESDRRNFTLTLSITGTTAAGTLSDDENTQSSVTGSVAFESANTSIKAIDVTGPDGIPSLSCTSVLAPAATLTAEDDPSLADNDANGDGGDDPPPNDDGTVDPGAFTNQSRTTSARVKSAEEIVDALLGTAH